jgi:hypothetical protein
VRRALAAGEADTSPEEAFEAIGRWRIHPPRGRRMMGGLGRRSADQMTLPHTHTSFRGIMAWLDTKAAVIQGEGVMGVVVIGSKRRAVLEG